MGALIMIKWEDYKKDESVDICSKYIKSGIECPSCGEEIYEDMSIEYLSNPPQHDFYCFKCGWQGRK